MYPKLTSPELLKPAHSLHFTTMSYANIPFSIHSRSHPILHLLPVLPLEYSNSLSKIDWLMAKVNMNSSYTVALSGAEVILKLYIKNKISTQVNNL